MEKAEKERKQKLSFHSVPTGRVTENSKKKKAKKLKKLKNTILASFQAKIGWKRMRKREIKMIVPFLSYPTRKKKFKKIAKKFKNFKNTIVASLQAKTGWKRLRKRENKNYRFASFLPEA